MLPWKMPLDARTVCFFAIDRWFDFWFPFGVSLLGFHSKNRQFMRGKKCGFGNCLLHTQISTHTQHLLNPSGEWINVLFWHSQLCIQQKLKRSSTQTRMAFIDSNEQHGLRIINVFFVWKWFSFVQSVVFCLPNCCWQCLFHPNHLTPSHYSGWIFALFECNFPKSIQKRFTAFAQLPLCVMAFSYKDESAKQKNAICSMVRCIKCSS